MSEKSPLKKLHEINSTKEQLEVKIKSDIKCIFKEEDCEDGLFSVEFYGNSVWIHLRESELISTEVFSKLNKYFSMNGDLSYSDGDGFIIGFGG